MERCLLFDEMGRLHEEELRRIAPTRIQVCSGNVCGMRASKPKTLETASPWRLLMHDRNTSRQAGHADGGVEVPGEATDLSTTPAVNNERRSGPVVAAIIRQALVTVLGIRLLFDLPPCGLILLIPYKGRQWIRSIEQTLHSSCLSERQSWQRPHYLPALLV